MKMSLGRWVGVCAVATSVSLGLVGCDDGDYAENTPPAGGKQQPKQDAKRDLEEGLGDDSDFQGTWRVTQVASRNAQAPANAPGIMSYFDIFGACRRVKTLVDGGPSVVSFFAPLISHAELEIEVKAGKMNLKLLPNARPGGVPCEMNIAYSYVRSRKHCGCPLITFTETARSPSLSPACMGALPAEHSGKDAAVFSTELAREFVRTFEIISVDADRALSVDLPDGSTVDYELTAK